MFLTFKFRSVLTPVSNSNNQPPIKKRKPKESKNDENIDNEDPSNESEEVGQRNRRHGENFCTNFEGQLGANSPKLRVIATRKRVKNACGDTAKLGCIDLNTATAGHSLGATDPTAPNVGHSLPERNRAVAKSPVSSTQRVIATRSRVKNAFVDVKKPGSVVEHIDLNTGTAGHNVQKRRRLLDAEEHVEDAPTKAVLATAGQLLQERDRAIHISDVAEPQENSDLKIPRLKYG